MLIPSDKELRMEVLAVLEQRAADRQTITYGDLGRKVLLPVNIDLNRERLSETLSTLTTLLLKQKIPVLTVLVVYGHTGRPNPAFFRQVHGLRRHAGLNDEDIFQFEKKYAFDWAAQRPNGPRKPIRVEDPHEKSLRQLLVAAALERRTLTYREATEGIGLDWDSEADRNTLNTTLKRVNRSSYRDDGVLLAALVIGEGGMPERGFFRQTYEMGVVSRGSQRAFWERERDKVFEHWSVSSESRP